MATYASSKGFEFTSEEYAEFVEGLQTELTEFETEMVVGGGTCKEKGHDHNRRMYKNKDGSVHGQGHITFPSGEQYVGEMRNGARQGIPQVFG